MRTAFATFIAWLQNDGPFGNHIGGDQLGDFLFEGGQKFFNRRGFFQGIESLPGQVLISLFLEPLA